MLKERDFKYVVSGNELSPLHVVYAAAECMIDEETKTHISDAIGMYDVWHAAHKRNEYRSWIGEKCIEHFCEIWRIELRTSTTMTSLHIKNDNHLTTTRRLLQFDCLPKM